MNKKYIMIAAGAFLLGIIFQAKYNNLKNTNPNEIQARQQKTADSSSMSEETISELYNYKKQAELNFIKSHYINFHISLYRDNGIDAEIYNTQYLTHTLESLASSIENYNAAAYMLQGDNPSRGYSGVSELLQSYAGYLSDYKNNLLNNHVYYKTDRIKIILEDLLKLEEWYSSRAEQGNFNIYNTEDLKVLDLQFDYEIKSMDKVAKEPFEGEGTKESPYLLWDEEDLHQFADTHENKYYQLMSDIRVEGIIYPSGTFTGTFNGNGHTISGLRMPLFDKVDGVINKLKLEVNIVHYMYYGENMTVGGLARYADKNAVIKNCTVNGKIEIYAVKEGSYGSGSTGIIGGIVGSNSGLISKNTSAVDILIKKNSNTNQLVSDLNAAAQIVGMNELYGSGIVKDNKCKGSVTADDGLELSIGDDIGLNSSVR